MMLLNRNERRESAAVDTAAGAQIMTEIDTSHPVLLYDGLCGFCSKGVQRILRYDKRKTMLFAALQGDYGKSILTRHPELKGIDSLVFVEPLDFAYLEQVFVRSDALLHVAGTWADPGSWRSPRTSSRVLFETTCTISSRSGDTGGSESMTLVSYRHRKYAHVSWTKSLDCLCMGYSKDIHRPRRQ